MLVWRLSCWWRGMNRRQVERLEAARDRPGLGATSHGRVGSWRARDGRVGRCEGAQVPPSWGLDCCQAAKQRQHLINRSVHISIHPFVPSHHVSPSCAPVVPLASSAKPSNLQLPTDALVLNDAVYPINTFIVRRYHRMMRSYLGDC